MAHESQITRAATRERAPIGADAMHRDAILAMPPSERDAAIAELARARRCVLRYGFEHADEALAMLGLAALTPQEKAAGPLPKPAPAPQRTAPAGPPTTRQRPPTRRRRQAYKECVGCREIKPASEFRGRSYRCHACREDV